ncbi:hypothetical protein VTO42DRAFT_1035 [Malbranchea cinnamomea]
MSSSSLTTNSRALVSSVVSCPRLCNASSSWSAAQARSPSTSHSCYRYQFHTTTQYSPSARSNRTIRCPRPTQRQQPYHSAFSPAPTPPADSFTPEQCAVLSAALSHVPTHGFSLQSLTLGARDAGYLDVSLQLFPRGGEAELVLYWLASRRGELRKRVEVGNLSGGEVNAEGLSVQDKVRMLIVERLKMNEGIIQHWHDALAIMSLPSNIRDSLCELYTLSSDILYLAGDTSIDASWYAKRMSVAAVYASAEISMTEDKSQGFSSTMEFVDRRIQDSNAFVDALGDAKKYLGYLAASVVAAGRSLGMKI